MVLGDEKVLSFFLGKGSNEDAAEEGANVRYMKGIGQGLLFSGLMVQVSSGAAVGATTICAVLGLDLMLLGAVLMVLGRSPKD
jgi:hypothetical protein